MSIDRRTFLAALALPTFIRAADTPDVIDTHTHFYDPSRPQGVPWPGKGDDLLYRTTLPEHYLAVKQPLPVTGTVVVEASPWLEDNQWLLDLAAKERFIVGIVGNLSPGTDEFAKHLQRFAANRWYRGIRIGHGLIQKTDQKSLIRDLAKLADANLSLDINGGPTMLPDVLPIAKALPKLRMVINHMANVRIDGKAPPKGWRDDMQRIAELPNTFCKLSALVEGTGHTDGKAPTDIAFYTPTLDVLWNAFGAERLIYGSNWKVSARFAPLAVVQQLVIDYCATKAKGSREWVFAKSAAKAYQWVRR